MREPLWRPVKKARELFEFFGLDNEEENVIKFHLFNTLPNFRID